MNYIKYKQMQIERDFDMLVYLTGCKNIIRESHSIRYKLENGKSKPLINYGAQAIRIFRHNFLQNDLNFSAISDKQNYQNTSIVVFSYDGTELTTVGKPYMYYQRDYMKKLATRVSGEIGYGVYAAGGSSLKLKDAHKPHAHMYARDLAVCNFGGFFLKQEKLPNGLTLADYYTVDISSDQLLILNVSDKKVILTDLQNKLEQKQEEVRSLEESIKRIKEQ